MSAPGLLVAGTASGVGKTTVTLGLLAACRARGITVQPFKCGPDYIDPAFHAAASGRASTNLDSWTMSAARLDSLAALGDDADLVIAEGSMGLFDGGVRSGAFGTGASADVARRTGWPVVLVLDVSRQARTAAAVALGCRAFDPSLTIAGVVLNRVASARHETLVRRALEEIDLPVFGALPRRADLEMPERHLGLVQAEEHPALEATLAALGTLIGDNLDIEALRGAATVRRSGAPDEYVAPAPPGQRIALARDAAFSFVYPHLLAEWRAAGVEILPFSPLADEPPDPRADAVWLPGGYPELHGAPLAEARRFRAGLAAHARTRPVHGECGGYMVLGAGLVDAEGHRHAMSGLLGLETSFHARRLHLGYRRAVLREPMAGHERGSVLLGHEFHHATIVAEPDAPLADIEDAGGVAVAETGSRRGQVSGSFFHLIGAGAA